MNQTTALEFCKDLLDVACLFKNSLQDIAQAFEGFLEFLRAFLNVIQGIGCRLAGGMQACRQVDCFHGGFDPPYCPSTGSSSHNKI